MKVFIRPVKGTLIRDPKTKSIIPKTGMFVELSSYWRRRIEDKSVVVLEQNQKESSVERKKEREGNK